MSSLLSLAPFFFAHRTVLCRNPNCPPSPQAPYLPKLVRIVLPSHSACSVFLLHFGARVVCPCRSPEAVSSHAHTHLRPLFFIWRSIFDRGCCTSTHSYMLSPQPGILALWNRRASLGVGQQPRRKQCRGARFSASNLHLSLIFTFGSLWVLSVTLWG
jgi:hypothetical protein